MDEVDEEQAQRLEAALNPSPAVAVQIGRVLASRLGLSLDERIELVDTVSPLVAEMLQQEQLSAALRELPPHELQLLPLLGNAVARADEWHAAACGCSGGHDDQLMDQARAVGGGAKARFSAVMYAHDAAGRQLLQGKRAMFPVLADVRRICLLPGGSGGQVTAGPRFQGSSASKSSAVLALGNSVSSRRRYQ